MAAGSLAHSPMNERLATSSIRGLVRAVAAERPDAIAVRSPRGDLSYRALARRAGGIAQLLARRGVGRGGRVGLYLDKSPDAVAGLVGILEAGAAYVPIDPKSPPERARRILRDCGLTLLLTSRKKRDLLPQILDDDMALETIVLLDDGDEAAREILAPRAVVLRDEIGESDTPPAVDSEPEDLAYVLYTSGSTGSPKGVAISDRASTAFVDWARETFALGPEDVVSSHAPFHFDLSILDLHASFSAGATVCLVPASMSVFPQSLAKFIETQGITTWYSVPSILIQMLLHGKLEERDFSGLRQVLFAGEVFHSRYLRELMNALPDAKFFNLYGPTETNVCTYHPVPSPPESDVPIPIGAICCGDEGFVVDEEDRVLPDGEKGELLVAGPTLMSGYWGDDEKTKRVLARGAEGALAGRLVYRTGDLVCKRNDGAYEFHGRRDNMVKTRGYRVELGEVEAALNAHEDVTEGVVIAEPHDELGALLIAFVVPGDGATFDEPSLKRFCAEKLPQYMIPERFHARETLPRTSTGKVDRDRLVGEDVE